MQGTRESHPSRGLQIMYTLQGFPRPFRNVVIDSNNFRL